MEVRAPWSNPPPHLAARAGGGLAGARGGGARRPSPLPLTFIDRPWAGPALPNSSLLSTTFIDRAQASQAWANPSLLLAGPDPSFLLLAGLGQARAPREGQGLAASGAPGGARSADQPLFDLAPPGRPGAPGGRRAQQVWWGIFRHAIAVTLPQPCLSTNHHGLLARSFAWPFHPFGFKKNPKS